MSKVQKTIKALYEILKRPVLLNRVLQDPDVWYNYLKKKYSMTSGLPVVNPLSLPGMDNVQDVPVLTFLDGGSLVTDIALLKGLAAGIKDCRYFEIGTWRGESAVNVAKSASEVYTLNLSDDELRNMGVSEGSVVQQGLFSKGNPKIHHLRSDSRYFDFDSPGKKFDLIFIDGSHHYEEVKNDTKKVFQSLVHDTSVVVWHDYAVHPEEVRYEVLAGILDGLKEEDHQYLYHVEQTKSAIFIRENLKSVPLKAPVKPSFYYSVEINYHEFKNE